MLKMKTCGGVRARNFISTHFQNENVQQKFHYLSFLFFECQCQCLGVFVLFCFAHPKPTIARGLSEK